VHFVHINTVKTMITIVVVINVTLLIEDDFPVAVDLFNISDCTEGIRLCFYRRLFVRSVP